MVIFMFITSLLGNRQQLDGGAMFGNAPREMWKRWLMPDEKNRIELQCRCFLIEWKNRKILLETGIGNFFPDPLKERFGITEKEHCLLEHLKQQAISPHDITDIILSHLHFDHAGGLLLRSSTGELSLAFPQATIYVGQTQWERAVHPHFRDKASYIPELHQLLLDSGRLQMIQGHKTPFQVSTLPDIFSFYESHGHTPGLLHTFIQGTTHSYFFASDLIPGTPWLHLPITMGYDRFPEKLIEEKQAFLPWLQEKNTIILFTHDPHLAGSKIIQTQGKWGPHEEFTEFHHAPL
jgi:glyoxylase-like metal-dependent hydrolase (beta-lactamase superfamily II)